MSLPMRGAWIEILSEGSDDYAEASRSPCGERGLKFKRLRKALSYRKSLPMRGAWIEINGGDGLCLGLVSRSPCGERGLK